MLLTGVSEYIIMPFHLFEKVKIIYFDIKFWQELLKYFFCCLNKIIVVIVHNIKIAHGITGANFITREYNL